MCSIVASLRGKGSLRAVMSVRESDNRGGGWRRVVREIGDIFGLASVRE
jgi:hypothetical protein